MLCAPLTVRHVGDLRGREAHFNCPTATVRLHTTDEEVEAALRRMTANMPDGGLSVTVVLEESVSDIRNNFMVGTKDLQNFWDALGRVDLRRTSVLRIGSAFLACCRHLAEVTLPPSLTEVGGHFLMECRSLRRVDMGPCTQ